MWEAPRKGMHACCVRAKSLQSCLTLCDPMDSSLSGSSVHGIFQARVLWKIVWQFLKHKTTWSSNSTPRCIPKRSETRDRNRYLHIHVHSSYIHTNQKVEATQVSTDEWMDKQNMGYAYNGKFDTYCNLGEAWEHYVKWDKAQKDKCMIVLMCMTIQIHRRRRWHPSPVLLPGKSHGWRSLVGYSPWGR